MGIELRKATRTKAKIRLGLSSTSGAGKTYSSLLIARGLTDSWDKIAIIDTENGSADLYSDLGDYNVLTIQSPFTPEKYVEAIKVCEQAGIEVAIVDSITHEWDWCIEENTRLGGRFQDWKEVTPRHVKFVKAVLQSSMHMICTVRRKQDYDMTKDSQGRVKVEKAGLKEQTREGWEYELTINLELDMNHNAKASKDRTKLFADQPLFVPTIETGRIIKEWCDKGGEPEKEPTAEELLAKAQQEIGGIQTVVELKAIFNKWKPLVDEIKLKKIANERKEAIEAGTK